jgi:hypothetical protein
MTRGRKIMICAVVGAGMLISVGSVPAAETKRLYTAGGGGHTEYTVSKVGGQTVVSFVACDDRPDGYGVVVLTYSGGHGLGVFTTDRNGSGNGCEERKRKSVTLRESISSVSLKVCLHDQNRNKDKSGLRKACRQTKTIS